MNAMPLLRFTLLAAVTSASLLALVAGAMANSAVPQTAELLGFSGHTGEWELTATLSRNGDTRELSGPLTMKHVGYCGQDGPETKAGEISVRYALKASSIDARMNIDGVECTYQGKFSDAYNGMMSCPDRRPVPLTLWLR
jgi:hypothetical protein